MSTGSRRPCTCLLPALLWTSNLRSGHQLSKWLSCKLRHGGTIKILERMKNTHIPGADLIALAMSGRRMIITRTVRRAEGIPGVIDLHATMVTSNISTKILLGNTGEILHRTGVINQDMKKGEDLETDTSHMAESATVEMILLTEVIVEEVLPHTMEAEGTRTTIPTDLTATEGNPVALGTTMVIMTEPTDRALSLTTGCQWNTGNRIPEDHQHETAKPHSAEDPLPQTGERTTINVGDVETKATKLTSVRCSLTGEENLVIVVCSTEEKTATEDRELL